MELKQFANHQHMEAVGIVLLEIHMTNVRLQGSNLRECLESSALRSQVSHDLQYDVLRVSLRS